jgi:diaminopimelate epimerase
MKFAILNMHGAGNRIAVVDQREQKLPPPSVAQLQRLGDKNTGPGFDQLMWVGPAEDAATDGSYRIFNTDGSEIEQCGNGARCVVWMLARENPEQRRFTLESPAGPVEAEVLCDGRITMNMGAPILDPARIPFVAEVQTDLYRIDVDGQHMDICAISMGNPHGVVPVDDVAGTDVGRLGPLLERHPAFPARANIGFMHIRDRSTIDLRVFERGVGETLACGTGSCAAVVSGIRLGELDEEVTVHMPGGQLVVSWRGGDAPVWLTGNAELISEETIEL